MFNQIIFDIFNGLYSGIPLCCIRYYIRILINGENYVALITEMKRNNFIELVNHNGIEAMKLKFSPESEYVQCDYCYDNNIVKQIKNNGTILNWLL